MKSDNAISEVDGGIGKKQETVRAEYTYLFIFLAAIAASIVFIVVKLT